MKKEKYRYEGTTYKKPLFLEQWRMERKHEIVFYRSMTPPPAEASLTNLFGGELVCVWRVKWK